MVNLHFICRRDDQENAWKKLSQSEFQSGDWHISDDSADAAIGGRLYLHEQQDQAAWHGGRILGWAPHPDNSARKIFNYIVDENFRVKCRSGWSQEMAIVSL